MEALPLANETESWWLKAPGQDYAINRRGGPVAGVMRMEMGYRIAIAPSRRSARAEPWRGSG